MNILRALTTVGGWTAASRVLGFARDVMIAAVLGVGPVSDAFFVAFKLPNFFRRLFAEGAFNAAFVPLFARRYEGEGKALARAFAEQSLSVMLSGLLVLTLLAMAGMPWVIKVIAPGFSEDPEKFDLTVRLASITFCYLLFMAMAALMGGVLNSLYRFTAAAAAPVLLNVLFLMALGGIAPLLASKEQVGLLLAGTVAVAGVGQFLLLHIASLRAGMALSLPRPRITPGVKRLFQLMVPGLLSAGAMQVNVIVGTIIASLQAGAVSWLYYADRVYQLPLGLIGIALGVVLLPELSRRLRADDSDGAMQSLNRGSEIALLLTLPATLALIAVPFSIVTVLFERGAFVGADAGATAAALAAYAVGLPAYVMIKLLQPAFFAREDTVTPLKAAVASVLANIVLAVALFVWLQHVGIALATALAAWLHVVLLAWSLARRGFLTWDSRFKARLPRMLAASLVMAAALIGLDWLLIPWFEAGLTLKVAALALLVGAGIAVYAASAVLLGAARPAEITAAFRRGRT